MSFITVKHILKIWRDVLDYRQSDKTKLSKYHEVVRLTF